MAFEAYKVAVRLSLVSNVAAGLTALTGQFQSLNSHVNTTQKGLSALEGQLSRLKTMGLIGGAMAGAGAFGLSLFKAPLEEAKKFQTEVAKFSALGLGDKVNADAIKFANGMDIMGSSARDNLRLLREATAITGDFTHAKDVVPLMAKMKFGLEAVMGAGQGSGFENMFQAALKTTELRGALINRSTGQVDTANFTRVMDMMMKAYVASGGMVKPQDYLAAIKTGGVSAKMMNDEMFFYGLGHFMQESGGSRTGTAAMSMFQNWAMGRMPQRVAERMAAFGLLDKNAIHYGKTGHITGVDPMGIINSEQFIKNPFAYVNEVVVPLLQKKGYSGDQLNFQLASLFGIRTASNLADQFVREQKVADLYVERAKKANGISQMYSTAGGTLAGGEIDLQAKWSNVLKELGMTILPMAIKGVEGLTTVLKAVGGFMREHPDATKVLGVMFATLSAAVAAGGVVIMATAAFRALGIALAFESVGGAVGIGKIAANIGLMSKAFGAFAFMVFGIADALEAARTGDSTSNRIVSKIGRGIGLFGKDDTLGSWLYSATHGDYNTVKPGASSNNGKHGDIYMDGKKVGEIVTQHQAKAASKPQAGASRPDMNMAPAMKGFGAFGGAF